MGILSKFKENQKKGTTRGFYFGSTEAEGENIEGQSLVNYFEDYLNILPLLREGRFIFLGRKGAGKSAIAKYIKDTSDKETDSYASLIKMQDLELEKLIQNDAFNDFENKELVIFEWLILVQLIKLFIKNDSARYTREYPKLKKFIDKNSGIVNIDKYQIKQIIEDKNFEVSFGPLKHIFEGVFKNHFGTKMEKAPFHQLIPPLREIVEKIVKYEVNRDNEFWLLFDDLDITFQENEIQQKMITELLRISKRYNNEILTGSNSKIVVFLRDDIKRKIESLYPDTGKLFTSYEIIIDWYDHETFKLDENVTNLKSFINRRIEYNFLKNNISYNKDNPWESLIKEDYYEYQNKTSFKYLIDFTFYRPRDLVLFFSKIGHRDYLYPLTPDTFKSLLKKYIQSNIIEIKNELGLNFKQNEINELFDTVFPYIIKHPHLTKQKLCETLDEKCFSEKSNQVFQSLKDYALIAFKSSQGKLFFEHRGEIITDEESDKYFITLPKCIYHYYVDIN
ncbi:hypothetical protein KI659_17660 [Litoribacter alkaliphilus]|uniref:FunZ protein n=1 Tax=Litoribacter ruber TaxID=702568 RepID=A0AAP2CQ36_9BACT|nr:hypothetical protein [Litoribacter alkaliphilus]MBS9525852.1 hypothetical protein [Litoribacter alkaliphilus]